MSEPFLLQADDADRYWRLRQMMLTDTPWAFASDPESDNARDRSAFIERLSQQYNEIVAIADDGGELVASAGVMRRPRKKIWHRADMWGVYVHPEHRRRGLGFAVVRAAVDVALGWPEVDSVALSLSERSEAIGVYERVGFERWGLEPACLKLDGEVYDEIHMLYRVKG